MDELSNLILNDFKLDSKLEKSLDEITKHVVDKTFYYRNAYYLTQNPNIQESFVNENRRRSVYCDSNFNLADFTGAGFTDSLFRNTNFENCNFESCNFESCYMFGCGFTNKTPYLWSSFAKSYFLESSFKNICFDRCRLSDAIFQNSTLEGCDFDNTSFDGTIFNNAILDRVSFKNLNLEYAQFNNIQINDTALPFPTIPFIVNGINYLINTTDNVYIKSAKRGKISKDEYLDLLPHLKIYYEKTSNYFALSNIYIAEGDVNNAYSSIGGGINLSIELNNYKQLKNYCILIQSCSLFNIKQKKAFIEMISRMFNQKLLVNYNFYYPMTQRFHELRNIILSSDNASLTVSFKTNIKNNDYKLLSSFYKTIDILLGTVGIESNYSINFSYNSDAEIITMINSIDTTIIVALITAFTTLLVSGIKGLSHLPDIIHKFMTIKSKIQNEKLEIENKKLQNKKLGLEISKMEKEISTSSAANSLDSLIKNIEPILKSCEELKNQGVHIENITYNSVNVDIDTLTEYTSNLIYNVTSNSNP